MSRNRKSRDSAAPRGSQYVDGQLIHMDTNQRLFLRLHVCTVFRETLRPGDQFLKATAERVMEKNLKKRQAHCSANLLENRFTLEKNKSNGKEPFRTWVGYREIEDIQRSRTKPEYFVLSVDSEKSGHKYYEVYKCKNKEEAYKFESLIRQAMEDPESRIRDKNSVAVVPVIDDPNMRRSMVHVDFQTSLESLNDNGRQSMYQATSPTPPSGFGYETPPRKPSPVAVVEKQRIVQAQAPPSPPRRYTPSPVPRRQPSPPVRAYRSIDGLDGITYIQVDPRTRRARESSEGPIYMYLSRLENKAGRRSPSGGRTGSPIYNSGLYNGKYNSGYYS
ncbi:hypothetical protein P879_09008 [Paragonimus westermani]|uniref:Trematode PH-like domain-containing protein n=1 Tax=Paragonimus westermani TaxID=34504 RepID=A0A8T0DDU0_9TREM|nr:hypothetical protein P879_09008 [Paragonimus westermani]